MPIWIFIQFEENVMVIENPYFVKSLFGFTLQFLNHIFRRLIGLYFYKCKHCNGASHTSLCEFDQSHCAVSKNTVLAYFNSDFKTP